MTDIETEMQCPIIAYRMGSFWFCVPHGEKRRAAGERIESVRAGNLYSEYSYFCDEDGCGAVILDDRDKLTQDYVWKLRYEDDRDVLDRYGRTVLISEYENETWVKFYPRGGRETVQTLIVPAFREFFQPCHKGGTVCGHCHSAPGILKV